MKHAELPAWFYDVDVHTHDRRASADGAIVCITPRESAEGLAGCIFHRTGYGNGSFDDTVRFADRKLAV